MQRGECKTPWGDVHREIVESCGGRATSYAAQTEVEPDDGGWGVELVGAGGQEKDVDGPWLGERTAGLRRWWLLRSQGWELAEVPLFFCWCLPACRRGRWGGEWYLARLQLVGNSGCW